jgi:hypothetical protein
MFSYSFDDQILEMLANSTDKVDPNAVAEKILSSSFNTKKHWIDCYESIDGLIDEGMLMKYDFKQHHAYCIKLTFKGLWYYHTTYGF